MVYIFPRCHVLLNPNTHQKDQPIKLSNGNGVLKTLIYGIHVFLGENILMMEEEIVQLKAQLQYSLYSSVETLQPALQPGSQAERNLGWSCKNAEVCK